jgi:hypothetical protein
MLKKYKLYILTALYYIAISDSFSLKYLLPYFSSLELPFYVLIFVGFYSQTLTYILFEIFLSFHISNQWLKTKTKKYFTSAVLVFFVLQLYRHFWFMNYDSFPLLNSTRMNPILFLSSPLFQLLPFLLTFKTLKQYQKRVIVVVAVSFAMKILYYFASGFFPSIQVEYYIGFFELNALRAIYYIDVLLLLGSVIKIKSENKL